MLESSPAHFVRSEDGTWANRLCPIAGPVFQRENKQEVSERVKHFPGARIVICFFLLVMSPTAGGWSQGVPVPDPEFLKAQTLESRGQLDEARQIYETLYQKTPNDLHFWKLMIISERLGDYTAMERFALDRLRKFPGDIPVRNYLSRAYHGQGDEAKARRVLIETIGDNWSDQLRVRTAANEFQQRNDLDGAIGVYLTARGKTGDPNLFALDLARLFSAQMNYVAAVGEYLKVLDATPAAYPSIEMLIRQNAGAQVPLSELARPLEQFLRANPKSVKAAKLLAQIRHRLGDGQGAFRALLGAAAAAGAPEEVWTFAEQLAAEGRREDALYAYSEYHRVFPAGLHARTALLKAAGLRMEMDDRAGAVSEYSTLVAEYPGTAEAQLAALRLIHLSEGDGADLTQRLKSFADSTTDRVAAFEAHLMLGDRYLQRGETETAGQAYAGAMLKATERKELYDVLTRSARLHFFTGEYDLMARDIESCVRAIPDGEESNDLLSLRLLVLRAATERDRHNLETYAHGWYALARGLVVEGIDSLAVVAADTASVVAPAASRTLGDHWRENGDAARALEWYDRAIVAARDTTVRVETMMAAAEVELLELRNPDAARKRYVDALTLYPGSVFEAELRKRLRSIVEK